MRRRAEELNREQMEARRLRAMEMFRAGSSQADIGRALGVSRTAVSRWARMAQKPGSWKSRKAPGRPRRVSLEVLERVREQRKVWTPLGFALAVSAATGVAYDRDHCSKLLSTLKSRSAEGPQARKART